MLLIDLGVLLTRPPAVGETFAVSIAAWSERYLASDSQEPVFSQTFADTRKSAAKYVITLGRRGLFRRNERRGGV